MGTTLVWEKGRQLKRFGNFTYKYNNDGIRIQKVEYNRTHDYTLDGTNIVKEIITASEGCIDEVEYLYDLDGTVCGLKHNGTAYYFYKNLQGDVIAITDDSGATVARYTYDAWGKVLSITDANGTDISETEPHIANINPFRYRSYYYDTETKLYYLQSRYYNPEVGRFINADDAKTLYLKIAISFFNMYSYCYNSPIIKYDLYGYDALTVLIGIFGTLSTVLSWVPVGGKILTIITIALSSVAMILTINGYNNDCKLLESRKYYMSVKKYISIKKDIDLVFYASLVAYIMGILLSLMGWVGKLLKKVALQTVATFLGVILGFTTGVVAWILDLGYTMSYDGLKRKMGVKV